MTRSNTNLINFLYKKKRLYVVQNKEHIQICIHDGRYNYSKELLKIMAILNNTSQKLADQPVVSVTILI